MTEIVVSVVVAVGVVVMTLQRFGWIPQGPTATAASRRADEAEKELSAVLTELAELRATRTLKPILEQLARNAELQTQVLDRLTQMNGSIKSVHAGLEKTNEGLELVVEGLRVVTGLAMSEVAVPAPRPARRRKTA